MDTTPIKGEELSHPPSLPDAASLPVAASLPGAVSLPVGASLPAGQSLLKLKLPGQSSEKSEVLSILLIVTV
jgi:hypothetical protein